ncbi:MAG: HAD family phosphatase [Alphaproteobacteria bacterium]|nr:MAG: HAD family phosphatase [Alphaproteobacteria bacterium]
MTKSIALFAFDLDGTLADTESISLPSAVATMRDGFGVPVTLEYWYANLHGLAGQALMDAIHSQFGITVNFAEYLRLRAEQVPHMFAGGVNPAPGMLQAVRQLAAQGNQLCICSNSAPDRIALTLTNITGQHSAGLNLLGMFEGHILSATGPQGQGKAKPAPDVYLDAAARYGATPANCVAVEDSPVGVHAAISAGFTCLGYTGLSHHGEADAASLKQAGAHHTFHHWDDFHALLATL